MIYIYFIIVAVVSFFVGRKSVKKFEPRDKKELKEMRQEAREALSERTEDRKEKIINYMKIEACEAAKAKMGITRTQVEALLGVSGGTALKYLNELEDEQRITQVGDRGQQSTYYTLNSSN